MAGLDEVGGPAVFLGQPVFRPLELHPRRLDRAVGGVGLHRFEGHARFAQPGQARVAELMTGAPLQPRPPAGAGEDLIEAFG